MIPKRKGLFIPTLKSWEDGIPPLTQIYKGRWIPILDAYCISSMPLTRDFGHKHN